MSLLISLSNLDLQITKYLLDIKKIMDDHKINELELIKLDIEGAENQVLPNLIKNKIFPNQILVEFVLKLCRNGRLFTFLRPLRPFLVKL